MPYGKGSIEVTDSDFIDGVQAGHLEYGSLVRNRTAAFTDHDMTELFMEKLEDVSMNSLFAIGHIAGWLQTLVKGGSL